MRDSHKELAIKTAIQEYKNSVLFGFNWSFHYENGTCLTDEERTELENWFITCG